MEFSWKIIASTKKYGYILSTDKKEKDIKKM